MSLISSCKSRTISNISSTIRFVSVLILRSLRAIFFSTSPSRFPEESNNPDKIIASRETINVRRPKGKSSTPNPIQQDHQII
jgi:hypothetical protein